MIEVDGSYGEGGGQILRLSVALSAITGNPVRIYNIRAKRRNPGLSYQHLTAIRAVAQVCNARVMGAELRSKELEFYPGRIRGGRYFFDVGTAGSVFLVLQSLLPVLIFAKEESHVKIRGGTDVPKAPPADYFSNVFLRLLRKVGVETDLKLIRRGFYPRGGGEIEIRIKPCEKIEGISLEERGNLKQILGKIWLYSLPDHIAERMKREAMLRTYNSFKVTPKIWVEKGRSLSPGTGIAMWAEYENTILGSDSLGERGKRAEQVARECVDTLFELHSSPATLDTHASDQLLIFLSLASSPSKFISRKLSNHASTCIWLLQKFLEVEFKVNRLKGGVKVEVLPGGFK